jgi:hypothetical protein
MADRNPVYQRDDQASGLETSGKPFDPPLLPFEKNLIRTLGCSEQEYKKFVRFAELKAKIRPAQYDGIPDVENDFVSIIITIAIGLALQAVSYLLTPKPTQPNKNDRSQAQLPDQVGPSSFLQTTAFDSVAALAEYGQSIPIPFGDTSVDSAGELTGGLTLAPSLVWSRCFSYGNYQRFLGTYVAGEWSVPTPNVNGMWVGTTSLTALAADDFALFWSSRETGNRLNPLRLVAGTTGSDALGSPTSSGDILLTPTAVGELDTGFSMAYNPSAKITFGTSTPIQNGTAHRFNWEIVSSPKSVDLETLARRRVRDLRRKIAGSDSDGILFGSTTETGRERTGMPGVGRAYSRRMGFINHNSVRYENRTRVNIEVGDTAAFFIDGANWKEFSAQDFVGGAVNLDDLDSSANSWRQRADQLLSIGSKWIISAAVWKIIGRDAGIWEPGKGMSYVFECVEILGPPELGIPGVRTVQEPLGGYEGEEFDPSKHCGPAFWNICRFDDAIVRNVRLADVTEIGIKSQVWNRAAGLANFNSIPSPIQLQNYDDSGTSVNSPRMDRYFARTSCFSIWVRPIARATEGETVPLWSRIPQIFCVTGFAPIDQYNWIRLRPRTPGRYEYRFVPRTGTDIAVYAEASRKYWRLDAQSGEVYGEDFATEYGDFRVTIAGELVTPESIIINTELTSDPTLAARDALENQPAAVASNQINSNTGESNMLLQAWSLQVLGSPATFAGQTRSADFAMSRAGGAQTMTVRVTATSTIQSGAVYQEITGTTYSWQSHGYQIVASTGQWQVGGTINSEIALPSPNPFRDYWGYTIVYHQFAVTELSQSTGNFNIVTGERIFEEASQVSDCSHYLELQKSNESGTEHVITYVNESVANEIKPTYDGMTTMAISIKSSNNINTVQQPRVWLPSGIEVDRLVDGDRGASHLFSDFVYYLLTSKPQGAGSVVPTELIDVDSLRDTGKFLRANGLFFDTVLEQQINLREYIYSTAPLLMCNFTIKNGRFGMMPALPIDSDNRISTAPVRIEQIFAAGNIIDESLSIQYIPAIQRKNFRAVVSYRTNIPNELPSQSAVLVEWADLTAQNFAEEVIDLTAFCTSRQQALLVARFLLSARRRVDHTITFKTVPDGIGISPGSYIRVVTEASSYNAANNGIVTDAGTLVAVTEVKDGTYPVVVYLPSTGEIAERTMTITSNTVTDPTLYGSIFTLMQPSVSKNVYQIEQLSLDEDGLVDIAAVHVPTDGNMASRVALDVMTPNLFRVFE